MTASYSPRPRYGPRSRDQADLLELIPTGSPAKSVPPGSRAVAMSALAASTDIVSQTG
jgi:hypothetical protein